MAGKERFLPKVFGRLHKTRNTPVNALGLQAVLTVFFILVGGGFRTLVNFYSVASWGFYFLTVSIVTLSSPNHTHLFLEGFGFSGFTDQGA